jgi:hypothetical protein
MPDEVERIAAIRDPLERLRKATDRLATATREVAMLSRMRKRLIVELGDEGMSLAQIGEAAGLSRGRIHQIRNSGAPEAGAFLGLAEVVIATPLKQEAIQNRPVVAAEDVTASQRLGELARSLGVTPSFETVPLGGTFNLNRPNLVVICGPRLSQPVADTLSQDTNVAFERADDGPWTLVDRRTDSTYRSGGDEIPERARDAAYLGRLPRPDGKGTVMIFTGIHPPGTLGVVKLLVEQIDDLYRQVKDSCFSAIVATDYDRDTHEPIAVELLTPLYPYSEGAA